MGNIRPPQYGIKKDELTLTTQDPNAVMYGVTSDNKFIPIKITNTGELLLGGTITLEPGDIQIGAVEIKNHNTDDRVFVSTGLAMRVDSQLQGFDPTTPGWEDITSTNVLGKQGVDVNVIGGGSLGISEAEDDDIADSKPNVPLFINLGYAHDPNNGRWERITQKNKRLIVDGSEVTQPISAISLPLATGATTEVTLQSLLTAFNAEDFASETTLSAISTKVATEVTLSSVLSQLDVSLSTRASEATLSALNLKVIKADTDNVTVVSTVNPPINGAHETMVRIPFGSVPATYGIGAQLTTTADRNHFQVRNDGDKNIIVSIDGTNDHYKLEKGEIGTWDGVTIPSGSTIRVRHDGAALTKKEVVITAWSDR